MFWFFFVEYVADEVLTYEEVALMQPDPQRKRPVVLIGMSVGAKACAQTSVISFASQSTLETFAPGFGSVKFKDFK